MMKNLTGIHIKLFVLICVLLFTWVLAPSYPVHGAESSCEKCHTSDQILKSLHKPPRIIEGEGEG